MIERLFLLAMVGIAFALAGSTVSVFVGNELRVEPELLRQSEPVSARVASPLRDIQLVHPRPSRAEAVRCKPRSVRMIARMLGDADSRIFVATERGVEELLAIDACTTLDFDPPPAATPPVPAQRSNVVDVETELARIEEHAKSARFVPRFKDGVVAFRILSIRSGSLFERVGLQNGDVIEKIDGRPLEELMRFGAVHDLKDGRDRVAVELERAGKKMELSVQLE
jgi:hypothetical protein